MNLSQGLSIAAIAGVAAFSLAACVSEPNRYGTACNSAGRDCTPVVCNSQDECQRVGSSNGYAYWDREGRYRADDPRYDPNDPRQARHKICNTAGDCYWVSPDHDGYYYDREGNRVGHI